ncbi:unnamed protein product [Heligmosomoides polygyrus]|uniref:LAM_G_DOMAIN domain-containing protein n=1 Tax=Heligmosomoides polygyrus TaxID=6339 RepID=A0A183GFZ1_HELPZ|nr:unnamed protein product [Heligmosomoides polygyrus]
MNGRRLARSVQSFVNYSVPNLKRSGVVETFSLGRDLRFFVSGAPGRQFVIGLSHAKSGGLPGLCDDLDCAV